MEYFSTLKLIIFDLDDTLTDNKLLDLESFRYLSRSFELYVPKMREISWLRRKSFLAKDIISWMINKSSKSISIEACITMRNRFLQQQDNQGFIKLKPNLVNTLKKLKSKGYLLIIVTSRTKTDSLEAFLQIFNLKQYFTNVYDKNSGTKGAIYKSILQASKLKPSEFLVVSNTLEDLLPAKLLGMNCIGIQGSYGFDAALQKEVKVITNLTELISWINATENKL